MNRFKEIIQSEMRNETVTAMKMIHTILTNEDVDEKGKPLVPASVKLSAAQFLIEHAVGKPTQRVETDISVRLQGLLAMATVGPGIIDGPGALAIAQTVWDEDDDVIDAESEEG